jgi:hypothetical protein
MKVPKGKSHGLVLLLDRSGSMSNNMAGSIEQILVLAMFCRKVNIPFVVYGFGDSIDGRLSDFPESKPYEEECFNTKEGDLDFNNVYLREYLNSKMKSSEFKTAFNNMMALKYSYEEGNRYCGRPFNEDLGNTPLNQALVALAPITNEFRKVNNLDLVNLVVVHDGDADNTYRWVTSIERMDGTKGKLPTRCSPESYNIVINDKRKQFKVPRLPHDYYTSHDDGMRYTFFEWFKQNTGAKIFGFFIAEKGARLRESITHKYINENGESVYTVVRKQLGVNVNSYYSFSKSDYVKDICAKLRDDKFIESKNPGYENFFILPGGSDL